MARPTLFESIEDQAGKPVPSASVTLLDPGTSNPISDLIYNDPVAGSVLTQPLSADSTGRLLAYPSLPRTVDLRVSGPGLATYTIPNFPIMPRPEDLVTVAGVQTLSGKTLSSPTINNPAISGGSWANGALTSPSLTTPTITTATLAGKTSLPTNNAARVFEGLASPLGNVDWGAAGTATENPEYLAIVIGSTTPTLAEGRTSWLIERHVKPQTLLAEASNPTDTLRVTTKVYDQGTVDAGFRPTGDTASITGVAIGYSQQRYGGFGTAVEGVVGYAWSKPNAHASAYSFYGIAYGESLNSNVYGCELDVVNLTGQTAYLHRQRPPGYRPTTTTWEGNQYALNLLAVTGGTGSPVHVTAGIMLRGGGTNVKLRNGIVFEEASVADEAIDISMLGSTIAPLLMANSATIQAAKAESNSGTAASATATTLTVAGTPWTASAFIGQWVRITGGTGVGQARAITANTNNTLTVGTWGTTPDATSTFTISPNKINVLGTASDNSGRFYNDVYWDWRNDSAANLYMRLRVVNAGRLGVGGIDPAAVGHFYGNTSGEPTIVAESGSGVASRLDLFKTGGQRWSLVNGVGTPTDNVFAVYDATNNRKLFSADINGNSFAGAGNVLATNATAGFFYIPITSGTPTGVPTVTTNVAPMVFDYGANKLWIYLLGWKSVTFA